MGGMDSEAELNELRDRLSKIGELLESAVCTKEPDKGVIWLSQDGPTHPERLDDGRTLQVYDHEYFSPLGDALIAAWELTQFPKLEAVSDGL